VKPIGLESQLAAGGNLQLARGPHPADAVHLFGAVDHRHAEIQALDIHDFDGLVAGIAQQEVTGQRIRTRRCRAHPRVFHHRHAGRRRPNGG
jgi:hypothetical protein